MQSVSYVLSILPSESGLQAHPLQTSCFLPIKFIQGVAASIDKVDAAMDQVNVTRQVKIELRWKNILLDRGARAVCVVE